MEVGTYPGAEEEAGTVEGMDCILDKWAGREEELGHCNRIPVEGEDGAGSAVEVEAGTLDNHNCIGVAAAEVDIPSCRTAVEVAEVDTRILEEVGRDREERYNYNNYCNYILAPPV